MSTNKKNNPKKNHNKAEEPEAAYDEKRIVFFDSFEEMNEYDYRYYANMTPEERLQAVYKMRTAYWPEPQITRPFGRHIYIKK